MNSRIVKCPICKKPYRVFEIYFDCYMQSDLDACPSCTAQVDMTEAGEAGEREK